MSANLEELKKRVEYTGILLEPYVDWSKEEGVPVIEDFCVDLHGVATKPWARTGTDGAIVHLKGRGDFISVFLYDLAPGARSAPQGHLFEEVIFVLSGHGSTTIEMADGTMKRVCVDGPVFESDSIAWEA